MMNKTGDFRSQSRVPISILLAMVLLVLAGSLVLAVGQVATLTLSKVSSPAGGTDFPITAVSYQNSIETRFKSPRALDQDSADLLYVVGHRASQVAVFDSTGTEIDRWGVKGKGPEELFRPDGLAVWDDGSGAVVYVADSGNNRIQYFSGSGDYLGGWGTAGTGDGEFATPQSVDVSESRVVYVADTFNHRVQVFTADGVFIRAWGSQGTADGQFSFPAGIVVDASGDVYVSDSNNHRIQVFDEEGNYLRQWGSNGDGPGQFNIPTGLSVGDGYILVGDTYNNRIQKFTTEGTFIAMWGEQGDGAGQFQRPRGAFYDPVTDLTYVLDIDNTQVHVFAQQTITLSDGQVVASNYPPGLYDITEASPDPWTFEAATCDGGSPTPIDNGVRVTLEDGASVNCTFENSGVAPPTYTSYLGYIAR